MSAPQGQTRPPPAGAQRVAQEYEQPRPAQVSRQPIALQEQTPKPAVYNQAMRIQQEQEPQVLPTGRQPLPTSQSQSVFNQITGDIGSIRHALGTDQPVVNAQGKVNYGRIAQTTPIGGADVVLTDLAATAGPKVESFLSTFSGRAALGAAYGFFTGGKVNAKTSIENAAFGAGINAVIPVAGEGAARLIYTKTPLQQFTFDLGSGIKSVALSTPGKISHEITPSSAAKGIPIITSEEGTFRNVLGQMKGQAAADVATKEAGATARVVRPVFQDIRSSISSIVPGRFRLTEGSANYGQLEGAFKGKGGKIASETGAFNEKAGETQPGTQIVRPPKAKAEPPSPTPSFEEAPTGKGTSTVLERPQARVEAATRTETATEAKAGTQARTRLRLSEGYGTFATLPPGMTLPPAVEPLQRNRPTVSQGPGSSFDILRITAQDVQGPKSGIGTTGGTLVTPKYVQQPDQVTQPGTTHGQPTSQEQKFEQITSTGSPTIPGFELPKGITGPPTSPLSGFTNLGGGGSFGPRSRKRFKFGERINPVNVVFGSNIGNKSVRKRKRK